ncbi:uncharacterized protein isoform X1 [Rhodnius prolixus]|uniref:uncharacterized protein isoform X1 n=1 Tax=Rhodnius prolixus TaxID=13249 RepID=UPI003D18CF38
MCLTGISKFEEIMFIGHFMEEQCHNHSSSPKEQMKSDYRNKLLSERVALLKQEIQTKRALLLLETQGIVVTMVKEEECYWSSLSRADSIISDESQSTRETSGHKKRVRAKESEEQRQRRLERGRERERARRAAETEEERARRLEIKRRKDRERRACESEEKRRARLKRKAERDRERRANETPEERRRRLDRIRERERMRRSMQSEEQREIRRLQIRQWARERRAQKAPKKGFIPENSLEVVIIEKDM